MQRQRVNWSRVGPCGSPRIHFRNSPPSAGPEHFLNIDETPIGRLGHQVYRIAYRFRKLVSFGLYLGLSALAYTAAFELRFDLAWPDGAAHAFWTTIPVLLASRLLANTVVRLSTGRWRFIGTRDLFRLLAATALGSVIFTILTPIVANTTVPPALVIFEGSLTILFIGGGWVVYRTAYEFLRHIRSDDGPIRRVLIVGAGEAGNLLVREMWRSPTGYRPLAFVDDDPRKRGMMLNGLRVRGNVMEMAEVVRELLPDEIIIAVPTATPAELRSIVKACEATAVPFRVLPGIREVMDGVVRLNQLREVRIEDLLGREPVQLTLPELAAELSGRTVLITGAAGSIGSELSHQVARHAPARLLLLDQAETELFYLMLELREAFPGVSLVPFVGDITDAAMVERIFAQERPDQVFHAAAYKHVPMLEENAYEAARNNVFGTWRIGDAAGRHGAAKVVLISTDKAVRPVSTMGASKRLAEIVMLELQEQYPGTTFASVRFGNVLGSSGSVLPIFRRQLAEGRPLTVTHPEVTRYFMTIPEAVQLVLLASLQSDVRGRIAMLEMGEPMRIVDLARNLLELSGMRHSDNHIVYTGLRAGERLHEKLVAPDEQAISTTHPKVRVIVSTNGHHAPLVPLMRACAADGAVAMDQVKALVEQERLPVGPRS